MGAIGALMAGGSLVRSSLAKGADCEATAAQTSGPFYLGEQKFEHNNDLTTPQTMGQLVYIRGHVLGQSKNGVCQALPDAQVEIWQACASGRYNNLKDPNPAPLDPHFKYWGETITDVKGEYLFKTIVPGAYPADTNWDRPPHVHFKISKRGYHDLITQMYFKGEALNDKDLILLDTAAKDRPSLIVDFKPVSKDQINKGFDPKALVGEFIITIKSVV